MSERALVEIMRVLRESGCATGCQFRLTATACQCKLTAMADATRVAAAASSRDPAVGLAAVTSLRGLLESLEELQVTNARAQGWSWQQIADALRVSRQAAHKKYRRLGF